MHVRRVAAYTDTTRNRAGDGTCATRVVAVVAVAASIVAESTKQTIVAVVAGVVAVAITERNKVCPQH